MAKAVAIDGIPVMFELTQAGEQDCPRLSCELYSDDPLPQDIRRKAIERIRFFLSLDDDLETFYRLAEGDSHFLRVIERLFGYHQVKFLTPFENACWAALVQRNPIRAARSMKERLIERYGKRITVDGTVYTTFPEPADLARAEVAELRAIAGEKRCDYVLAIAEAFCTANEQFLRQGEYAQVRQWLLAIKGIGEWSANFILIRGLGRMEDAPLADPSIAKAASAIYNSAKGLTTGELHSLAERYGDHKGYWAHYLRVMS